MVKSENVSTEFLLGQEIEWEVINDKLKRQIMGFDDKIMLVKVDFKAEGIGPMHEHHHSQVTYVVSGEFLMTIGEKTTLLKGGDSFYVPPHVWHGCVCQKDGILIDVFSPMREDFLNQ